MIRYGNVQLLQSGKCIIVHRAGYWVGVYGRITRQRSFASPVGSAQNSACPQCCVLGRDASPAVVAAGVVGPLAGRCSGRRCAALQHGEQRQQHDSSGDQPESGSERPQHSGEHHGQGGERQPDQRDHQPDSLHEDSDQGIDHLDQRQERVRTG